MHKEEPLQIMELSVLTFSLSLFTSGYGAGGSKVVFFLILVIGIFFKNIYTDRYLNYFSEQMVIVIRISSRAFCIGY